jgi:hypothetical protein
MNISNALESISRGVDELNEAINALTLAEMQTGRLDDDQDPQVIIAALKNDLARQGKRLFKAFSIGRPRKERKAKAQPPALAPASLEAVKSAKKK